MFAAFFSILQSHATFPRIVINVSNSTFCSKHELHYTEQNLYIKSKLLQGSKKHDSSIYKQERVTFSYSQLTSQTELKPQITFYTYSCFFFEWHLIVP